MQRSSFCVTVDATIVKLGIQGRGKTEAPEFEHDLNISRVMHVKGEVDQRGAGTFSSKDRSMKLSDCSPKNRKSTVCGSADSTVALNTMILSVKYAVPTPPQTNMCLYILQQEF